ncbi:MAG: carbon-nitrogen hydrolase family protein [Proteobacteria bacterium]|nr:carbon-nitrogen hydrolase family protein [Pseudomonadota bacterium]
MIPTSGHPVTLALLHLAPRPGDLDDNRRRIDSAALAAAAAGARLVVTPELALSGYGFRDLIGTGWIAAGQTERLAWAAGLARRSKAFLLLGTPEAADAALFNSLLLFAPDGTRLGGHRKVNALRVGSESWSTPGDRATVLEAPGIGRLGLAICADLYSRRLVAETAAPGIDLLVSGAAWAPGHHGPDGEWERASADTGRPVVVCNRTGPDSMDFTGARSVVAAGGAIAFEYAEAAPATLLFDWQDGAIANWRHL